LRGAKAIIAVVHIFPNPPEITGDPVDRSIHFFIAIDRDAAIVIPAGKFFFMRKPMFLPALFITTVKAEW
jgi:hypothetical protein